MQGCVCVCVQLYVCLCFWRLSLTQRDRVSKPIWSSSRGLADVDRLNSPNNPTLCGAQLSSWKRQYGSTVVVEVLVNAFLVVAAALQLKRTQHGIWVDGATAVGNGGHIEYIEHERLVVVAENVVG